MVYKFIILHVDIQFPQNHLLKKTILSPIELYWPFLYYVMVKLKVSKNIVYEYNLLYRTTIKIGKNNEYICIYIVLIK